MAKLIPQSGLYQYTAHNGATDICSPGWEGLREFVTRDYARYKRLIDGSIAVWEERV